MADANTTLYGLVKPEVGASADTWGAKTNADWDDVDALLGAFVLTGSTSAYVLTTGLSLAAYAAKQRFLVKWNHTNGTTPTLNVDGLGAKSIKKRDGSTSPSASDLVSGVYNEVVYDGTNFVVVNLLPSDFQPLDATLTALAALSYTSGTLYVTLTASDTFTLKADTTLVHTTGAETVAGAKTFTSAVTVNLNSGTPASPVAGTVVQYVNADSTSTKALFDTYGTSVNPGFDMRRARGTLASPTAVQSGDILGAMQAYGYGATGFSAAAKATLRLVASENWTDSAQGTRGQLHSTDLLSTTLTERYRWGDLTSTLELGFRDGGPGTLADATKTFALTDRGTPADHSSGSAHTYTVPPNSSVAFPPNAILFGTNFGAGALTIARGSGVTFRDASGTDADLTVNQYQSYYCRRHPTSADVWTVRVT